MPVVALVVGPGGLAIRLRGFATGVLAVVYQYRRGAAPREQVAGLSAAGRNWRDWSRARPLTGCYMKHL